MNLRNSIFQQQQENNAESHFVLWPQMLLIVILVYPEQCLVLLTFYGQHGELSFSEMTGKM